MNTPDPALAVRYILSANEEVTERAMTRIYTDQLPQAAVLPAIIINVITEMINDSFQGETGLERARIQVQAIADFRPDANELGWYVRKALGGFTGDADGVCIDSINRVMSLSYDTDSPVDGGAKFRFVSLQDFYVHYDSQLSKAEG